MGCGTMRPSDYRENRSHLAEHLERAGYDTLAVMGAFVLHSNFGLNQGFGIYSDVPRRRLNLGPTEDQRTAGEVVDEALRPARSHGWR